MNPQDLLDAVTAQRDAALNDAALQRAQASALRRELEEARRRVAELQAAAPVAGPVDEPPNRSAADEQAPS